MTREQRLAQIAEAAVEVERRLGYPAALIVAQWAAESAWGTKETGKHNFFGMTKAARHKDFRWCATREVLTDAQLARLDPEEAATVTEKTRRPDGRWDVRLSRRFASYESLEAAIEDKVRLLMDGRPYREAYEQYRQDGDLDAFVERVAPIYATDPGYATLVKTISRQRNVLTALAAFRRDTIEA
ncbi:MAG: glucosaminidase domain-containing protein [Bryobacteraceae bacterium]